MAFVLVRLKVRDFSKWKRGFDSRASQRRKVTLRQKALMRNVRNPREVVILFQAGNLKKARAYGSSAALRKAIKASGVLGKPEMTYLK